MPEAGTATSVLPEKVPQPHGGALNNGGTPNNKGGGRTKDEVRQAALEGAAVAVPKLLAMLERDEDEIVLSASDKLLKYGLGTTKEVTVEAVREKVQRTLILIRQTLPAPTADALIQAMRPIWATAA